jgi:iron complex outermembrane receptor protein
MKTENLLAYELGWRWQIANNLDIDTALFYNIYDRMLGTIFTGGVTVVPGSGIILSSVSGNYRQVTTYGSEISLNYRINTDWRLQASYSNIFFVTNYDHTINWFRDPLTERNSDPQQTMSVRSQFDVTNEVEFDIWGRYVDQLTVNTGKIPGYFALDLRMGWHPIKDLELSLSGQNLLDNQHPEFLDKVYIPTASQIQRSYFAQITWHF